MRPLLIPLFPVALLASLVLAACSSTPPLKPSAGHLRAEAPVAASKDIPAPVAAMVTLTRPKAAAKAETYSVSVHDVPVKELLFALVRDAKLNVDVHPGVTGEVTLNAFDQTLQQILARVAKQVDLRWEIDGPNLVVMPDKPFLRTYKIDFLNMARDVKSKISTSTQIASAGASGSAGGNTASTSITSDTKNDLLKSLISNITDMLVDEDKIRYNEAIELETSNQAKTAGTGAIATGSSLGSVTEDQKGKSTTTGPNSSARGSGNQSIQGEGKAVAKKGKYEKAVSVFANSETGVLIVRATGRQHDKVQEFIDKVMTTAKRQVLIEATIVEVRLSDNYKQGINWSALRLGAKGFEFRQAGTAGLPSANTLNIFTVDFANPASALGNLAAQISLLESFGTVKVLSSPKLSVMNNQTATLKVADNKIYFTVKADTTTSNGIATTTFTTTPNEVSVGFLMNVTPQISDAEAVTINIRPTITRILSYVNDPNPSLATAGVVNRVPEIQTREMESILKIDSGQTAVMGGLMQDDMNNLTDAVPGLGDIPGIGNFFRHRNDTSTKTELVIFLKPTIIRDPSINGDYRSFRDQLPGREFFSGNTNAPQREAQGAAPP
ncbi:MAG: pilus (MSHA type) biogenesis protein MshL [Sulfuritalea sp.]|nr:pilus (MSHA type) biogenesis protein MshL [Sulfuritalea sp.]